MARKIRVGVIVVLLILIIFALFMAFAVYTNGFQSFSSRYVICNGQVLNANTVVELCGRSPKFNLTGAGFTYANWGDYEVKIVVNPAAQATYTAGDENKPLDNADVTANFLVERSGQTVTIEQSDYNLQNIAKQLYGNDTAVSLNLEVPSYIMTVTDEHGKSISYLLKYTREPEGVTITPEDVISG